MLTCAAAAAPPPPRSLKHLPGFVEKADELMAKARTARTCVADDARRTSPARRNIWGVAHARVLERSPRHRAQGVDTIACVSVNDPFVMDAWGKSVCTQGKARGPSHARASAAPSGCTCTHMTSCAAVRHPRARTRALTPPRAPCAAGADAG